MKLHFEDCPYGCNVNGMLFDRGLKKMVSCPHCESRRRELASEGSIEDNEGNQQSLHKELGFSDEYLTSYFSFDSLISKSERPLLESSSFEPVEEAISLLRGTLSRGDLPEKSYCFGLARKGSVDKLAFPLLVSAYEKGGKVGKFISSRMYYSLYMKDKDLQEYYDLDILFVLVNSGSSYRELMCIRGLMEARAVCGKATIFVTNNDIDEVLLLLGSVEEPSLYLASPYFIERSKTANSHSYASDALRGNNYSPDLGISMEDMQDI